MTGLVQCSMSGALVDPAAPLSVIEAACPECGRIVHLGGTPAAPRYELHNEPTLTDTVADLTGLGAGLVRYVFGDAADMRSGGCGDRDAVQDAIDRADDHVTRVSW